MLDTVEFEARIRDILDAHRGMEGALLPILHAVQDAFGHVPEEALPIIAASLDITKAEAHGVMSFYHDFRSKPAGRTVLKLCRAEACQAAFGNPVAEKAKEKLGVDWHETTADGAVTLEPVFCLGLCACAPAAMVGDKLVGMLTPKKIAALIDEVREMKVWLPLDSFAVAMGGDEVAGAIVAEAAKRGFDLALTRNGSRGMAWLEPLAEVEVGGVRHAFGPMTLADVPGLFGDLAAHPKALGPVEELDWMKGQTRLTFARVGVIDPLSLEEYRAHGGLAGLDRALTMDKAGIVAEVTESGLRGRGGAGFPTGIKWKTVSEAAGEQKYIVCNADEGDSATFADRMLMEGDPFCLIEGMIIAGLATGATKGFVYIRSEYPIAIRIMRRAVEIAREAGVLGAAFDMEIRVGAGAYVCGEETSLLNSLEGKRGVVRAKPPLPALQGFMGRPTVVNNVISLASVPVIMARGAAFYKDFGLGRSRGTIPLQIAGNVKYGGLYETAFGLSLGEIVDKIGGGTFTGRPVKAVQVGGPLGAYFPRDLFDTAFGYEEFSAKDGLIGHAGLTIFDDRADMLHMARFAMEFCAIESCGKCTPCRIGAVRGVETVDRIANGDASAIPLLTDLCATMKSGSLCALGGFTPYPVMSALTHFPDDFQRAKEAAE